MHDVLKRSFGNKDSDSFYTTVPCNVSYFKLRASCQSINKSTRGQKRAYCLPVAWLASQIASRLKLDSFISLKQHSAVLFLTLECFIRCFMFSVKGKWTWFDIIPAEIKGWYPFKNIVEVSCLKSKPHTFKWRGVEGESMKRTKNLLKKLYRI